MYVIGTAGHIDHGKSTLVRALTGIDPDRLREEKERGMTIDLGFAWLRLPSGREVSIVDVPGHERFIKNMLAGVGGIDLALLVIAADEGIMPQTEEHLSILELLRVKRAVVALTKRDLVEEDWLELVTSDVADRLARSPLGEAPIVPVSAVTRAGLEDLQVAVDRALDVTAVRPDRHRPRVPIDRVFTIGGFGTVVTGTLIDGSLSVGQDLEVQPGGMRTRARGLQSHKQKVERADPGSRVAINVANLAVEDLERGQVLTSLDWLQPTTAVDAHLSVLASAPPLLHNAQVSFHTGSAEVTGHVRILEADLISPGDTAWVQIALAEPVAVAKGDLFVIRSPNATLGGGEIVETQPRRHRRRDDAVIDRLEVLESGTPTEVVRQAVAGRGGNDLAGIIAQSGLTRDEASQALRVLVDAQAVVPIGERYVTPMVVQTLRDRIVDAVLAFHQRFPLRPGIPREELRSRVPLPPRDAGALLDYFAAQGWLVLEDSIARHPEHAVRLAPEQEAAIKSFVEELDRSPFAPPDLDELARRYQLDEEVLAVLSARGEIVRVSDGIAFASSAFDQMKARIVDRLRANGTINVAEVRDMFDTSRKYALAVMEYFDQQRLTRRVGDTRVLR
jgi:selenocysteine-specific elongation factor